MPPRPTTAAKSDISRVLLPRIAPSLQGVPFKVVTHLVAEDRGELRLVLGAQQQAGPYLHHAVGRHAGVEIGRPHDVDAQIAAMYIAQPADHLADIGVELGIADEIVRALDLALRLLHRLPQAAFVGAEQRLVAGLDAAARHRWRAARQGRAAAQAAEKLAPGDGAHFGRPVSSVRAVSRAGS